MIEQVIRIRCHRESVFQAPCEPRSEGRVLGAVCCSRQHKLQRSPRLSRTCSTHHTHAVQLCPIQDSRPICRSQLLGAQCRHLPRATFFLQHDVRFRLASYRSHNYFRTVTKAIYNGNHTLQTALLNIPCGFEVIPKEWHHSRASSPTHANRYQRSKVNVLVHTSIPSRTRELCSSEMPGTYASILDSYLEHCLNTDILKSRNLRVLPRPRSHHPALDLGTWLQPCRH
jgi:hypothetical protein